MISEQQLREVGLFIRINKHFWMIYEADGRTLTSGRRCFRSERHMRKMVLEKASVWYVKRRMEGWPVRPKIVTFGAIPNHIWATKLYNEMKKKSIIAGLLELKK